MIKILWSWDYWDGPLSGLCLYAGRVEWFSCFAMGGWRMAGGTDDDDASWTPRVYRVHRLTWLGRRQAVVGRWIFRKTINSRRLSKAWYKIGRRIFRPKPQAVVGAFSDGECFGR
jgi:hypothetical protein